MLKASALYMVIIIALVIGIICSSLIVSAYFYRLQYQKTIRYSHLQTNLESSVNILLAGEDTSYNSPKLFSLFNLDEDSVSTQRMFWGMYDIGVAKAMIQRDTLYKVFSIAHAIDSSKWAAIYLTDNSRPLSISGSTSITGNAFISPAGIDQAYVNNQAYTGDKRLIVGTKHNSEKKLPELNTDRLKKLELFINQDLESVSGSLNADSIGNSFSLPTKLFNLKTSLTELKNIKLNGNIILFSDTSLLIDSTAVLNNIIVIAKSITVHSGFHGNCQLFAHDTIGVQKNCRFDYPSSLGIIRFDKSAITKTGEKIGLYTGCIFKGSIFTYEQEKNPLSPLIHIGHEVKVIGQVYSQGYVEFEDKAEVDGSVFTDRFLYQTAYTRFENYLINTTINSKLLSPYYLTGQLFPVAAKKKKVLQWLEAN